MRETEAENRQNHIVKIDDNEIEVRLLLKIYRESGYFSKEQIVEIAKGMTASVNASLYADEGYSVGVMRESRKILEAYQKVYTDALSEELELALKEILSYGLDEEQMREVRKGVESGCDYKIYLDGYNAQQMEQIRDGLERKLDVLLYANTDYSEWEMEQIKLGLISGVDVSVYANKGFSRQRMNHIREALVEGMDISFLEDTNNPEWKMFYYMHEAKKESPVMEFVTSSHVTMASEYFALGRAANGGKVKKNEVLSLLKQGIEPVKIQCITLIEDDEKRGLFVDCFIHSCLPNESYSVAQLTELVTSCNMGLDVFSLPFTPKHTPKQIFAIRKRILSQDSAEITKSTLERMFDVNNAWENIIIGNY